MFLLAACSHLLYTLISSYRSRLLSSSRTHFCFLFRILVSRSVFMDPLIDLDGSVDLVHECPAGEEADSTWVELAR
jgi:hypothetical protein